MRIITRTIVLAAMAAIILAGCNRANSAAPTTPQQKPRTAAIPAPAPEPVPAPAPEPEEKPAVSEGWVAEEAGFPFEAGSLILRNKALSAAILITSFPSAVHPGGAVNHVTARARQMAKDGMLIEDIVPISGMDAAWVPFTMPDRPVIGGFAAKTSAAQPESTLYFRLYKNVNLADPGLPAELERLRNDFLGIIAAADLEIAQEPDKSGDGNDPDGATAPVTL